MLEGRQRDTRSIKYKYLNKLMCVPFVLSCICRGGEFADHFGFSIRTLEKWEQGVRQPEGAARAYLVVIDRNPKAVEKALNS